MAAKKSATWWQWVLAIVVLIVIVAIVGVRALTPSNTVSEKVAPGSSPVAEGP